MSALTRRELDAAECMNPECTHAHDDVLYLKSACHPAAGTWSTYDKRTGEVAVTCSRCERPVMSFKVAAR